MVPRSPELTALFLTVYVLVMLGGGLAFGPTWFRRADALALLYRLFGRVAPIHRIFTPDGGYRICVRPPWNDCTRPVGGLPVAAFVIATVYTVSFDGFTNTPEFQTLLFAIRDGLDVGPVVGVLLYLVGYASFVGIFLGIVVLTQWAAGAETAEWRSGAFAFAPTILPIAVAYEVAHNYPFVVANVGRLPAVLWPFLGGSTGPTFDLLAWLSVGAYWWSELLLIVAGHIVAVIAAHYVTITRYSTTNGARRGHVPLTALMVGYTVLSLWIVSRPIVTG